MKKIKLIVWLLFVPYLVNAQNTLQGTIKDEVSGLPISGAVVFIPDLRAGVAADVNGKYNFEKLPSRSLVIQVKSIGYQTIVQLVDLVNTKSLDFKLKIAVLEKSEVVVTGSAFTTDHARTSLSVEPLEKLELQTIGATNITEAIAQIPGVAGISTGGGISKPVIRGLGYNRIITINEGLRQEGQQWGDEHGLEIDQFSADRIEVLKGPASLMYGSDALGGVINILEPIPASLGTIRTEINSQYSTNNKLFVTSAMAEGNQQGFVWRLRGTLKDAAAFKTPTETVYNSAFNERNGNLMFGLNKKWGYNHFHISTYQAKFGLIEGERDSLTNQFVNSEGEIVANNDLQTRTLNLPFQKVDHFKISSVGSYFIGKGNLRATFGWQQNDRQEFEDSQTTPGLFFRLNTVSGDLKFYFPQINNWDLVLGVIALNQINQNKGEEYLIPAFTLNEMGGFFSAKKEWEKWTFNTGLRYDYRAVEGQELDGIFKAFNSKFDAVSGSVGATYEASNKLHYKLNVGRGFRSPNISELSANGIHEGTFRYEIGDPNLNAETSLQFDAAAGYESKKIGGEISVFYNHINNFIYYRSLSNELVDVDGTLYPVFNYVQGNSVLYGAEFSLDLHLLDPLHFENKLSYVKAQNEAINQPLPFIPPFHLNSELSYQIKGKQNSLFKSTLIKVFSDFYGDQNEVDIFETKTEGALIFGAGISSEINLSFTDLSLFIIGNNLLDEKYFNHLSRLKDAGIYSMGRNFTFGLSLPLTVKN